MTSKVRLVGTKRLSHQTDKCFAIDTPKRGKDQHSFRRWWSDSSVKTKYVDCTRLRVNRVDGDVYAVIPSKPDTRLDIIFDGNKRWRFGPNYRNVDRIAIYDLDNNIIEEYVFSHISKGQVMKVLPPDAASYPSAVLAVD
jgi:hypothetical protein